MCGEHIILAKLMVNAMGSQIAKFMVPTWGPPGSCGPQIGPMNLSGLAPCAKLSAATILTMFLSSQRVSTICFNCEDYIKCQYIFTLKQGKSEGFESCDRPIVRKRPIWVKIGDVLSRVTLKFDGWPWKTIGHLSFAVSSFVQHFIAIGEFKLELQSGNAQFGSNSTIFRAV